MRIFISWSGERSMAVAKALKGWLRYVIQSLRPWMSDRDIAKGARWQPEIAGQLEQADAGIICLTRENVAAPWILFEAGALAKRLKESLVCPYLLDFEPSELTGPLAQFQAAVADKQDTLDLLRGVNNVMEKQLSESQLVETFEKWWPKLEADLANIPGPHEEEMAKRAKEFRAYEMVEDRKICLPLLSEPVHTYADVERNVDHGAVFAFTLGDNNPEVMITFERITGQKDLSCELSRIGCAEMHVLWDGKEIWKSNYGNGEPHRHIPNSYISFRYDDLESIVEAGQEEFDEKIDHGQEE